MKHSERSGFSPLRFVLVGVLAALFVVACTTSKGHEVVGSSSSAVWTNGDFETGVAGTAPGAPWTVQTFLNPGITVQTPQTFAGLNLATGGAGDTVILNAPGGPGTQTDPDLGAGASLRWPRYGNQCAIVNQHGNGQNVNILSQTMTVAPGDVDPIDGQVHVRFAVAPVLQNPAHAPNQQPYYFVILTDTTQGTTLYSVFNLSGAGIPWQTVNGGTPTEIDYTDWQLVDISGAGGAIAIGDSVTLQIIGAGCSLGAHFGEIYVDGVGAVIPGVMVEGTGPAQANPGTNVTYTLSYQNGGASSETNVTVTLIIPANTTFQSINAPGLSCTTPAVGATGTVTCTIGTLAAGASGTFTVTVGIDSGTATGTTITEGQYSIQSDQETPLLGPPINTLCGCTTDSQCLSGNWCDETTDDCTPTLANGTTMPDDPAHTSPVIDGTCTPAAAAVVCTSGVCDTTNDECGYVNGDGPCTTGAVCQSGACDPDGNCGYANGDGPCTAYTAGVVCRSGACSVSGTCEPVGGCNVDGDCTGGDWCDESVHTCTPPLVNGVPVPTDPPHTSPTLNGTCTPAAGALVCVSGVCSTMDNECGYAVGDGPCTPSNAGVVCRSGACSTNGTCEPAGGCDVDADCSKGNWCDESTHTCTPELPNSSPMPSDPAHTSPTLNGTCNAAAGALVCVSGVCDGKDNECGYANGDGPCTMASGPTVCRSGVCSENGTCEPAGGCNVDADCGSGQWCDETKHACAPTIANGQPVPKDPAHKSPTLNGTCTPAAGALVCTSKVCDTKDNECGYADGDGPCTMSNGGTVCRSGTCSADGTCEPSGGCNVNADCTSPRTPFCDPTTHMCEAAPDGGLDGGGSKDGGERDARAEDALRPGDAGLEDGAPGLQGGFVEGGGLSCDAAPEGRGTSGSWAGLLVAAALAFRARRRRA